MGVPYIKIYQLPQAYTVDADTDIQFRRKDELVPVVPKLTLLSDVKASDPLTGIIPVHQEALYCFDYAGGRHTHSLIANPSRPNYWIADGATWSNLLWEPVGALQMIVKDANGDALDDSEYTITEYGLQWLDEAEGATIEVYYKTSTGTADTYAFAGDTFYRGSNPEWNRLLLSQDDADYEVTAPPNDGVGYITVSGVASSLVGQYACEKARTRWFLSEHPNWVGGHVRMWPDIFVGEADYPGDQYADINGQPVEPGTMPTYRNPGTYTIVFRDGMVEFPEEIDSTSTPVKANYAYLTDVANVTGQILDAVNGSNNLQYKADSELIFTGSHDKRWVGRNDAYTPINVYVDGVITPQVLTVATFDTLDIVTE